MAKRALAFLVALLAFSGQIYGFEILWKERVFGTYLGSRGLILRDVTGDSQPEIIATSAIGTYAGNSWFVLARNDDDYAMVWSSAIRSGLVRLDATAEAIYVAYDDGAVEWYDLPTLALVATGQLDLGIKTFELADVDGDGHPELVALFANKVVAYELGTWREVWSTPYGGASIAVANFDNDPATEIAIGALYSYDGTPGRVIDTSTGVVEWSYVDGFGQILRAAQLDADAPLELLSSPGWYTITAIDVVAKSPIFDIDTDLDIGALRPADLGGDGVDEIVIGDAQWGDEYVVDAATRARLWSIRNPEHGTTEVAVGNLDDDSALEIVWGAGASSTGPDYLYVAGIGGTTIDWQSADLVGPFATAAADIDGDGAEELFTMSAESDSGYENGVIRVYDGKTHALRGTLDDFGYLAFWTGMHSLRVGDVDDDGALDLVIATASLYDGLVLVYDAATLTLKHQSAIADNRTFEALALGDIDGDGHTEIIVGVNGSSTGSRAFVFDGATLTQKWSSSPLAANVRDIAIADVDADGVPEFVLATSNRIYVYDGATLLQQGLWAIPAQSVALAQLDDDDALEIVSGGANGTVSVVDGITGEVASSFATGTAPVQAVRVVGDPGSPLELLLAAGGSIQRRSLAGSVIERIDGLTQVVAGYGQLTARDLDNDGRQDVLVGTGDTILLLGRDGSAELCNGIDDDNDGLADENLVRACASSCGTGVQRCAGAIWGDCTAPLPVEGLCPLQRKPCDATPHGGTKACSSACGVGTQTCNNGELTECSAQQPVGGVCYEPCGNATEGDTKLCNTTCDIGTQTCVAGYWTLCDAVVADDRGICPGDCDGGLNGDRRECPAACHESFCVDGFWTVCTSYRSDACPLTPPSTPDEPVIGSPGDDEPATPPPQDAPPSTEDPQSTPAGPIAVQVRGSSCAQIGGFEWSAALCAAFVMAVRRRRFDPRSALAVVLAVGVMHGCGGERDTPEAPPPKPILTSISPDNADFDGDTVITLTGDFFEGATGVGFGSTPATDFTVDSDTQITATTPYHELGTFDVRVATKSGFGTLADGFTFHTHVYELAVTGVELNVGLTTGGDRVTLAGYSFTPSARVYFGEVEATDVSFVSEYSLAVTTPAHAAGKVDVHVVTETATATRADAFTYGALEIASASPAFAIVQGSKSVVLTGVGFTDAFLVLVGGASASFTTDSDTQITITTPPHAAGIADITVRNLYGTVTRIGAVTYVVGASIASVTPKAGSPAGGTLVSITGTGFIAGSTSVAIDGIDVTPNVLSDTLLTITTPPHFLDLVPLSVSTPYNTAVMDPGFTYMDDAVITNIDPAIGPTSGGTRITITGSNFAAPLSVSFGGLRASVETAFQSGIIVSAPAHAAGAVDVVLTTAGRLVTVTGGYVYE